MQFRSLCAKVRTAIRSLSAKDRAELDGALPHLIAQGSTYSFRINAADFLKLCARLGIDPVTGQRRAPVANPGTLCLPLLGAACAMTRHLKDHMSLRDAAEEIGVSASTLSRLEQSLPISIEPVLAVCAFIGVHPFEYMAKEKQQRRAA